MELDGHPTHDLVGELQVRGAILYPGTRVVVIGAGGLGHIGIQCLKALTPAEIIVVDRSEAALDLARS